MTNRFAIIICILMGAIIVPYLILGFPRKPATLKPTTIDWIGHPVVSDNAPYTPSQGWLPGHKIGLRSDGVVVWTNLNATNK